MPPMRTDVDPMSIVLTRDVFCDGVSPSGNRCACWADNASSTTSAADARKRAKADGWKRRGGRDLCPLCAEAGGR